MEARQPTSAEQNVIEAWLSESETELFMDIGTLLPSQVPPSIIIVPFEGFAHELGRAYFAHIRERLVNALCLDWQLCKKLESASFVDQSQLVVAIADVIKTAGLTFPAPVLLISATIVKMGAHRFCGCGEHINLIAKRG
jgi:hypothetical protein